MLGGGCDAPTSAGCRGYYLLVLLFAAHLVAAAAAAVSSLVALRFVSKCCYVEVDLRWYY